MIIDLAKLVPPELAPYTQDLEEFKQATGVRLFYPPLGTGGGGAVLAAEDTQGNSLAIKVIAAEDAASRDQALREAAILKQVQHAAALGGQGLVWQKHYQKVDLFFLAMDFIPGQTLTELIATEGGSLAEALALELTLAVAEALQALHRQQIIHRDVKPDNVIILKLGQRYQPILVDYGIAKVGNNRTARGARAATDGYAPPEQYKGGTDQRSDVYALGATLYEMVTGQTPPAAFRRFPGDMLEPRQCNAAISLEVELIIQVATAYQPQQRFPTMDALIDALGLAQSGNKVALLALLQAMNLLPGKGKKLAFASAASLASLPPVPPLPMKRPAPKPAAPPATAPTQGLRCPHCQQRCQMGEAFCDACGAALDPTAQIVSTVGQPLIAAAAAAQQFAIVPAAPVSLSTTPGPQWMSLLFAQRIILGGPALGGGEKVLLVLAYWFLLASITLGGCAVGMLFALSHSFTISCALLFLLLVLAFAKMLLCLGESVITRRGQASPLRRSVVVLFSLIVLMGLVFWWMRALISAGSVWFLHPPALSILVYAGLACFASTLIQGLLA